MNITQALQQANLQLKNNSTSVALDAEVLLAFVLKKNKEFLYTYPEYTLTKTQIKTFNKLIKQRQQNAPLAYLLGQKEFYGLKFIVNKHVLIPRPESELIVAEVIKSLANKKLYNKKIILIDIGTGSGCLPIAIGKKINKKIKILATDISLPALKIAKSNARQHKVPITFFKGNLLAPFFNKSLFKKSNLFFFITANLPYLTLKQLKEKTIQQEPRLALYGGKDGLDLYKKILEQIKTLKISKTKIFLEIDPAQNKKIKSLIKKFLPKAQVEIKKDLAQRNRMVIISL